MNKWLLHTSYLKGLQKDKKTPLMLGDIWTDICTHSFPKENRHAPHSI
jgi:hypothetical protein